MMTSSNRPSYLRQIRGSLVSASVLLVFDVANGTFISAGICPIWFLVSLIKAIKRRPGWGVGLSRIAIPVLLLAIVAGNAALQSKFANANAERIIAACEQFRAATGKYPDRLDELVPKYLNTIPRARYALMFSDFQYRNPDGKHQLMWTKDHPMAEKFTILNSVNGAITPIKQ